MYFNQMFICSWVFSAAEIVVWSNRHIVGWISDLSRHRSSHRQHTESALQKHFASFPRGKTYETYVLGEYTKWDTWMHVILRQILYNRMVAVSSVANISKRTYLGNYVWLYADFRSKPSTLFATHSIRVSVTLHTARQSNIYAKRTKTAITQMRT